MNYQIDLIPFQFEEIKNCTSLNKCDKQDG